MRRKYQNEINHTSFIKFYERSNIYCLPVGSGSISETATASSHANTLFEEKFSPNDKLISTKIVGESAEILIVIFSN